MDRGLRALDPALLSTMAQHSSTEPPSFVPDKLIIGGAVHFGGFDADFADSTTMPGEVIGGTLTNDEKAMIQLMEPEDRVRYLLHKRIQEKAEMAVLSCRSCGPFATRLRCW